MNRWLSSRVARRPTLGLVPILVVLAAGCGGDSGSVPLPTDVIGFAPGEDFKLADYAQVTAYFQALAQASDRVILEEIGRSTRDEPLYLAMISTPQNLDRRDRYKEIARRLSHASDVTEEAARGLAQEGKAIIWIDGGLHATEVAHGQVMPEMARYFATDESPETQRIRENAILLLMVNMNPDGLNIVSDWYMSNVGTEFEIASVPELYHPYIGHDNNRDWYMLTQVETQAVTRQLYHEWFPQIVYNQHQSGPFPGRIWMPPFENPVNPNLDPLLVSSLNQMGHSMRKRFDIEGKQGVSSDIVYDLWWNGSMRGGPDFHNMLGFLTETALYRYATPGCYDDIPESFNSRAGNLPARTPSTNYNNPWEGGCWHMRDAMDYMMTAAIAVADIGARLKEEYLFNAYWMGRRQIEKGENAVGGPFAYVIDPEASHDPGAAIELLRLFHKSGIEIYRTDADFTAGAHRFPAGSYVIPPQAYRPYVVDLMEAKTYPDRRQFPGGPPEPPYDMTGYELRYQLGVAAVNIDEPFDWPGDLVEDEGEIRRGVFLPEPGVTGGTYILKPEMNQAVAAVAALLKEGATVERAGVDAPLAPGSFRISGVESGRLRELSEELGVEFSAIGGAVPGTFFPMTLPRIGIYRSWTAPMPEGWTRWVLDQYGLPWENLWDEDIRTRDLTAFDVIILPAQSENGIRNGHEPGSMPEQYVGGLGEDGSRALQNFVNDGGWVVAFDGAVDYAIQEFGLPFRNQVRGLSSQDFFLPGSIIRLDVDPSHPLGWGMPEEAVTLFARSQVLTRERAPRAGPGVGAPATPVCYAESDFLVSGWTLGGDQHLAGRTAAAQVGVGEGQVVLFAFTPHFRGQPRNTYKLLFNALMGSSTDGLPGTSPQVCR